MSGHMHFVEYTAQGEEGREAIVEVARHVHAFNREHDNTLGIDFPEWAAGDTLVNASRIRVFGVRENLAKFIAQPRGLRLLGMGFIARSALTQAPEDVPVAAVVRDNAATKNKPSHAARRAARGVEAYQGKHAAPGFTLGVSSKTTGQAFLLKMRKKEVLEGVVAFNSYGLCIAGGLPQF